MDNHEFPIDPQLLGWDALYHHNTHSSMPSAATTSSAPTNAVAAVAPAHTSPPNDAANQTPRPPQPPNSEGFKFTCPLCGMKKSRRYTIKQHFPKCVENKGNPNNLLWTDHPSTNPFRARKKNSLWNKDREGWRTLNAKSIGHKKGHKARAKPGQARKSNVEEPGAAAAAEQSTEMADQHEEEGDNWEAVRGLDDFTEEARQEYAGFATGPYDPGSMVGRDLAASQVSHAAPAVGLAPHPFVPAEAHPAGAEIDPGLLAADPAVAPTTSSLGPRDPRAKGGP